MSHVFISYKRGDRSFTDFLENRLIDAGFNTWTDNALRAGEDWRTGIDEAIHNSFALVLLMTPTARESEYVTYEWAFAMGLGIQIIPVMLMPTKLHPKLESLQYLDFTDRGGEPWEKLIERLNQIQANSHRRVVVLPRDVSLAVKNAVNVLDHPNADDIYEACRTLGSMADRDSNAFSALMQATKHSNLDVRISAAAILGNLGNKACLPRIIEMLSEETNQELPFWVIRRFQNWNRFGVKEFLLGAIKITGGESVKHELLSHMEKEPEVVVRQRIVDLLSDYGDEAIANGCVRLLTIEDNADVQKNLTRVAVKFAGPSTVETVLSHIEKMKSNASRRKLLDAVFDNCNDTMVDDLIKLLPEASQLFDLIVEYNYNVLYGDYRSYDEMRSGIDYLWDKISSSNRIERDSNHMVTLVRIAREHQNVRDNPEIAQFIRTNADPSSVTEIFNSA